MVIIYSRGGRGKGAGFYEGHKVFRGGLRDQSSPTEFKGGRPQKMDFHLTSNEGGGEWGGSDKFYRDKTEYSGDPSLPPTKTIHK